MAAKPRKLTNRLRTDVRNYVTWLADRLFVASEIKSRVTERFGVVPHQTVTAAINQYVNSQIAASEYRQAKGNTRTESLNIPRIDQFESGIRYIVRLRFDNPKSGERESRTYSIDLPSGLQKKTVQSQLRDKIVSILASSTTGEGMDRLDLDSRIGPISVQRIVGF